jgi:PadR family transcriptional regulator, regulatory protein PadR
MQKHSRMGGAIKMTNNYQKEVQTKLTKGLLDMIILQFLAQQPMHGYQVIIKIRKDFGICFGPSTVYPELGALEKKRYVKSVWNMDSKRPRKVYALTKEGENVLSYSEDSLNLIRKTVIKDKKFNIQVADFSAGSRTQKTTSPIATSLR